MTALLQAHGTSSEVQMCPKQNSSAVIGADFLAEAVPIDSKPMIIGLYGVSGSGKTYLLKQLEKELQHESYSFFEGSETIAELMPGGLDAFKKASIHEKLHWRELAISTIRDKCVASGTVGIVTGHFMFWEEEEGIIAKEQVCTSADLNIYTHILYLNVPVDVVAQRRRDDRQCRRAQISSSHLQSWQESEKDGLRHCCHEHGIIFHVVPHLETPLVNILTILRDVFQKTEAEYHSQICCEIDGIVSGSDSLETMLVLDADKTLAPVDTGVLFWQKPHHSELPQANGQTFTLRTLFGGPLGYSTKAFLQTALLYEEIGDSGRYEALCEAVVSEVVIHREFITMLQIVAKQKHVGVIVLTCGLQLVWEKVLEKEGLLEHVRVIGNGRVDHGCIVTPFFKAAAIHRLKDPYQMFVWAFGDSPLDLPMLREADQAVIVVGNEYERSKTMDSALADAVELDGLKATQTLLPSTARPRLDPTKLPIVQITAEDHLDSIVRRRNEGRLQSRPGTLNVFHATEGNAAKLLMTPMRDATVAGPRLREAHRQVGWYLAIDLLARVLGIENHPIPHVQGHQTDGFRIRRESQTIIVALMRGGEPMALGVNDALPLASFLHAQQPEDLKQHHFDGINTMILVDSVMNSGRTLIDFVRRIRSLVPNIHIVILLGVVQAKAIAAGNPVRDELVHDGDIDMIALRVSENKFTGKGTTDTGNRLFNTTHLD